MFQDEELLFSDRQQKDNDPDVDLFATSGKTVVSPRVCASCSVCRESSVCEHLLCSRIT